MSLRKCKKQTKHSLERLKERTELDPKLILSASKKGLSPNAFKSNDKLFEYFNHISMRKRVKVYKGIVFIFNNTSNRCITVYPIKEEFVEEYNYFIEERKNNANY